MVACCLRGLGRLPRPRRFRTHHRIDPGRNDLNLSDVTLVDRSQAGALEDFIAGRVTLFSTADFPGMTYTVLALRRDFIRSRPADVVALLRVWHRAEQYVRDNPDESSAIVAKRFDVPVSLARDLMNRVRVLDLAHNRRAFSYAAGFESLHGSWRRMNDFMMDHHLSSDSVHSPSHLNSRFIGLLE